MGRHLEATHETERLEVTLNASQATLTVAEGRVVLLGRNWRNLTPGLWVRFLGQLCFFLFASTSSLFDKLFCSFVAALTEHLEALQLATNNAAKALKARGDLLVNRLQDIPVRAGEIALHGVRHGAVVALTIA
jgi:hypothetical protein